MTLAGPPVREVRAVAYRIPTDAPEADGTLSWDATTIVVVHAKAGAARGLGWTYAPAACAELIRDLLAGVVCKCDALAVPAAWRAMQRAVRNVGRPGLASCALAAVETALWDAAARLLDLPLAVLLGRVHDEVAVYGSGGFTSYDDEQLRGQLQRWTAEQQLGRVKIKIGEGWGTAVDRDLARVARVRELVADDVEVYVDANGGYSVGQAIRVGARLAEHGVTWFEEPVSSDDLAGLRQVRGSVQPDVTAGEYGYDLASLARMVEAGAVDCLQVDVTRCGGYTEWLRIAAVAAAHNLDVSAHCAQNLTAPVAAATPNIRHLEWFHDHERIETMLFDGALDPTGGTVRPDLDRPGHGMSLRDTDAEPYRVA